MVWSYGFKDLSSCCNDFLLARIRLFCSAMRNSSLCFTVEAAINRQKTVSLLQMPLLPVQVVETSEGRLIPSPWRFEQPWLRTKNCHWPSLRKGWRSTKKSTKMRFSRIFSFLGPKPTSDNVPGPINNTLSPPTEPNPCNNGATQICRISSTPLNGLPFPRFEPLDYSIWNELQKKACSISHTTLESLKRALTKAWADRDLNFICNAVDSSPRRLRRCIKANGGYFENC